MKIKVSELRKDLYRLLKHYPEEYFVKRLEEMYFEKSCIICKGKLHKTKTKFKGHVLDAYKCNKCGEEFFNPKQAEEILSNRGK